ncbi:MAG: hypothetical protein JSU63_15190, partial [Phycisphaerales bacterium]
MYNSRPALWVIICLLVVPAYGGAGFSAESHFRSDVGFARSGRSADRSANITTLSEGVIQGCGAGFDGEGDGHATQNGPFSWRGAPEDAAVPAAVHPGRVLVRFSENTTRLAKQVGL